MLRPRVMPCLLLDNGALVKSIKFDRLNYVGDPCNAIRIFNELEVDELILLDISASAEGRPPDIALIAQLAGECFMPLTYGGGVRSIDDAKRLFRAGVEKVSVNSRALESPDLVAQLAEQFGSQSVVVTLDVKKRVFGGYRVYSHRGTVDTKMSPLQWLETIESLGAGEVLLMSVDRDGTWSGYDLALIDMVCGATGLPVVACGGAGGLSDIKEAFENGASAAAVGSMVVYQKRDMGVLINYPSPAELESITVPMR